MREGSEDKIPLTQLICTITQIATPPIIASLVYFIVQFVSIYYIGNLDDSILLAGVGMGNMLINIIAFAILYGLN
jgi:Na+-driven multidrug efflux pump